jgi:hypothetical protein
MNRSLVWLACILAGAALLSSGCQMMPALSRACLQEEGCEHHPINR